MKKKGIVAAFLGGLALVIFAVLPTGTFEDVLFAPLWAGLGNPMFVLTIAVLLLIAPTLIVRFLKG